MEKKTEKLKKSGSESKSINIENFQYWLLSHRPKLEYLNLRLKAKFNQLRFEAQVSIQYI